MMHLIRDFYVTGISSAIGLNIWWAFGVCESLCLVMRDGELRSYRKTGAQTAQTLQQRSSQVRGPSHPVHTCECYMYASCACEHRDEHKFNIRICPAQAHAAPIHARHCQVTRTSRLHVHIDIHDKCKRPRPEGTVGMANEYTPRQLKLYLQQFS